MTNFLNIRALALNPKFIELSSSDLTPRQIYLALIKSQVLNPNTGQPYSYPTVLKYLKISDNKAPLLSNIAPPPLTSFYTKRFKRGFSSFAFNPNFQVLGRSCKCFLQSDGATLIRTTFTIKGINTINVYYLNDLVYFVTKVFSGYKFRAFLVQANSKRLISYGPAFETDYLNPNTLLHH